MGRVELRHGCGGKAGGQEGRGGELLRNGSGIRSLEWFLA